MANFIADKYPLYACRRALNIQVQALVPQV